MKRSIIQIPPRIQLILLKKRKKNAYLIQINHKIFSYHFPIIGPLNIKFNKNLKYLIVEYKYYLTWHKLKNRLLNLFLATWIRYARIAFVFTGRTFRVRFNREKKRLRMLFAFSNKARLYFINVKYKRRNKKKNIKRKFRAGLRHPKFTIIKSLAKQMIKIRPISRHTGKGIYTKPKIHRKYKQKKNKAIFHRVVAMHEGGWTRSLYKAAQTKKHESNKPPREYFNYRLL